MTKTLKDTPKSVVQWVLDFLNINCKQGESNSWRLPSIPKELRELKRPPLLKSHIEEPPESIEIKDREVIDKTTGYVWRLTPITNKKVEWVFYGKQSVPTLANFKDFFLNAGIPPIRGNKLLLENGKSLKSLNTEVKRPKNWFEPGYYNPPFEVKLYSQLLSIWSELSRILSNMVWDTKTYDNERKATEVLKSYLKGIRQKYEECLRDDEIPMESGYCKNRQASFRGIHEIITDGMDGIDPFPNYGMLPQALYACILDFGINHKELLPLLRQCQYCGSFWIKNDKRKDFCSSNCNNAFNKQSRPDNVKSVSASKKITRTRTKKSDYSAIMDFYIKAGYSKKSAEEHAHKWVYDDNKTLENFNKQQIDTETYENLKRQKNDNG